VQKRQTEFQKRILMGEVANYINFFCTACHRTAAEMARAESPNMAKRRRPSTPRNPTWWRVPAEGSGRRAEGHPGRDRGAWREGREGVTRLLRWQRIPTHFDGRDLGRHK
jgi:hypothetical protein